MVIADNKIFWLKLIAICIIAYFTIFNQLDKLSLRWWDEASYGLNAQEMIEHKNPVVVYLKGEPDRYNSKPPLAIWCMSVCVKVFGLNELGIRFASATFAFATVLLLFFFTSSYLKNLKGGFIASLILCSSTGYMGEHIARTGDTDSILAFWILLYVLSFIVFATSENIRTQNKALFLTALFLSFACLTKGIGGLTAIPGLLVWAIIDKKIKMIFQNRNFYFGLAIFILLVPGYYVLREILDPGYFEQVVKFEFGGRLHQQEFINPGFVPFYGYYAEMLINKRCMPWVLILPIAILSIIFSKKSILKTSGLIVSYAILSISLILAFSQTKTPWYDAPLYPLFAFVIGIALAILFETITELPHRIMTWGLFLVLCYVPFTTIINDHIYKEDDAHLREFFNHYRNDLHKTDKIIAINNDPYFPLAVYIKKDNLNGFSSCQTNTSDSKFKINDVLLTLKYEREVDVYNLFVVDTIDRYFDYKVFRIKEIK